MGGSMAKPSSSAAAAFLRGPLGARCPAPAGAAAAAVARTSAPTARGFGLLVDHVKGGSSGSWSNPLGAPEFMSFALPAAPVCTNRAGAPGPCGFTHRWLKSSFDGAPIYSALWSSRQHQAEEPRAVVVYAHGLCSHVHDPRGFESCLMEPLARRGYAVLGFDRRGHGRTGKATGNALGDIGTGAARLEDLATVIDAARQRFPKSPLFVMGHGNGGSEALVFLGEECEQAKAVQGVVLLSPRCDRGSYYSRFLQFCIKVHSIKRIDVQDVWDTRDISKDFRHMRLPAVTLKHIFQTCDSDNSGKLGLAEFARALNTEMRLGLSTEEIQETFKKFDADGSGQVSIDELVTTISYYCPEYDYCVKSLPTSIDFAWYDDAMKPERITAPTLLVHGLQNRVNTFEAAKRFVNAMSSEDKTIQCFKSLRQGTACDLDAPRVLHSVVSWLDART